jgi:hypothetical protein
MVGSDCSFMRLASRLWNTPATRGRSSPLPVSFSTMEARITSSCGVLIGMSGERLDQTALSTSRCAPCMRLTSCWRVIPRSIR